MSPPRLSKNVLPIPTPSIFLFLFRSSSTTKFRYKRGSIVFYAIPIYNLAEHSNPNNFFFFYNIPGSLAKMC